MKFNNETILLLINTMKKYGWIDLPAHGTSMFPLIKKGEICRFVSFEIDSLKRGDIILYHSSSGQLVAHRFYKELKTNDKVHYILKGDTNLHLDDPIFHEQIIGKLVMIQKKTSKLYLTDFSVTYWGWVIIKFPILTKVLRRFLTNKVLKKLSMEFPHDA
ncbi:signal peptidase I [Metabacillus herbersteinensis]|uniref:Signal peptidase I n=1 Tax=Metabacillus herbersteinensis TaxID=283816 RepID=A0ABV6G9P5_9BACI